MGRFLPVTLNNGRELSSSCFLVSSSDRGAMLFMPSERAIRNFMAKAREDARKLFGEEPVIIVPPRITRDEEDRPWLPPVRMVAEFTSAPMSDAFDYSTAVVIWFQQGEYPLIGDDVREDFVGMEWEKYARDVSLME
jgi:hypothetical protein